MIVVGIRYRNTTQAVNLVCSPARIARPPKSSTTIAIASETLGRGRCAAAMKPVYIENAPILPIPARMKTKLIRNRPTSGTMLSEEFDMGGLLSGSYFPTGPECLEPFAAAFRFKASIRNLTIRFNPNRTEEFRTVCGLQLEFPFHPIARRHPRRPAHSRSVPPHLGQSAPTRDAPLRWNASLWRPDRDARYTGWRPDGL